MSSISIMSYCVMSIQKGDLRQTKDLVPKSLVVNILRFLANLLSRLRKSILVFLMLRIFQNIIFVFMTSPFVCYDGRMSKVKLTRSWNTLN